MAKLFDDGFIVKKNRKYGVVNSKEEILPIEFDGIKTTFDSPSLQLKKNNKFGIYQLKRKEPNGTLVPPMYFPPVYPYPIIDIKIFNGYEVGYTWDRQKRRMDFYDKKGFKYFEED